MNFLNQTFLIRFYDYKSNYIGINRAKGSPLPNICHTYTTMMKLGTVIPYLKKIQKIYQVHDTPPQFHRQQHFFTRNKQILLYQELQIQIAF